MEKNSIYESHLTIKNIFLIIAFLLLVQASLVYRELINNPFADWENFCKNSDVSIFVAIVEFVAEKSSMILVLFKELTL